MSPGRHVAIVGAGPVGVEAALYARELGWTVSLLEAGERVAAGVRRLGHVRWFSPWRMNVSPLGLRRLPEGACARIRAAWDNCPSGAELADDYLEPLARGSLADGLRTQTRVVGMTRGAYRKGDHLGQARRSTPPFRLLVEHHDDGESVLEADVVLDCSGVTHHPNPAGAGGIPAIGERSARESILYRVPDLVRDLPPLAGRRLMVVGSGHSAATTLSALAEASGDAEGVEVVWVIRNDLPHPYTVVDDDPLPARSELATRANALVDAPPAWLRVVRRGQIERIDRPGPRRLRITLATPETREEIGIDGMVVNCGYRPDNGLLSELQYHACYATDGPMRLAAELLGGDDGGDCLSQTSSGPDTLRSPEPDLFVLGSKSYGRNPNFLVRLGREQVRDVFRLLEGDAELDLYAHEPEAAP